MSFCNTILLLLFISYVARVSGGLFHVCFAVGDLIPMLHVFFLFEFMASF